MLDDLKQVRGEEERKQRWAARASSPRNALIREL